MTEYIRKGFCNKLSVIKCVAAIYIGGFLAVFITMAISKNNEYRIWKDRSDTEAKQLPFSNGFYYPLNVDMVKLAHKHISGEKINVTIINPHPFVYLQNPMFLCSKHNQQNPLRLMILVKSSVQYFQLRVVIRNTWGKKLLADSQDIKYAFLLGYAHDLQYIVDIEQHIYQDIIQEDFYDTYRNNTYKTIMGFNWIVEYCKKAQYVLFLDDDMYLNVNMLRTYLNNIGRTRNRHVFSGIFAHESPPVRVNTSKHFVSLTVYPYNIYPDYLAGSFILASYDVICLFQAVFPYIKYLPIDDSYLGIVANKLKIKPVSNSLIENQFSNGIGNISRLISVHGFRDHVLYLSTFNQNNV